MSPVDFINGASGPMDSVTHPRAWRIEVIISFIILSVTGFIYLSAFDTPVNWSNVSERQAFGSLGNTRVIFSGEYILGKEKNHSANQKLEHAIVVKLQSNEYKITFLKATRNPIVHFNDLQSELLFLKTHKMRKIKGKHAFEVAINKVKGYTNHGKGADGAIQFIGMFTSIPFQVRATKDELDKVYIQISADVVGIKSTIFFLPIILVICYALYCFFQRKQKK